MQPDIGFRGVIPVLQTPFYPDGAVDFDSLRREVRFVGEAGAPAMAFPGFASEWWKLSEPELFACFEVIAAMRPGQARLIANVTAQSTFLARQYACRFVALGAEALMCLPPFFLSPGPEAALAHLRAVLEAAPLPHILQYSASLTGSTFTPEQLANLHREYPHFSCVKLDFIPAGPTLSRLVETFAGTGVTFLVGYAGLQLPEALARGAHGMMPGAGHLPEDLYVFRRLRDDREIGLAAFQQLLPLLNLEMQTVDLSISVHKRLLYKRGIFESDHVREPGLGLDRVQESELMRYFRQAEAMAREISARSG